VTPPTPVRPVGLERRLVDFCRTHQVPLSEEQLRALVQLDQLVVRWNRAVGLTAFRTEQERFARYFAEPLHAARWAPAAGAAWDLGSGGGTPALPLALVRPGLRFHLVEPNRRKCLFLEEAVRELGLGACRIVRERLERVVPEEPATLVTSRGLAAARIDLSRLGGWLSPEGRILLFSGQAKAESLAVPSGLELAESVDLAPDFRTRLLVIRCGRSGRGRKASAPAPEGGRPRRGESGS